jgi:transcriptional regulator with XRE-family HTH domain
MARRWGFRPRTAFRYAHGWSQDELAARFTGVAQQLDSRRHRRSCSAPMIGRRIGEYERWPHGGRRPSVYVLTVLAVVLSTSIDQLLDADDWSELPDRDRTVLATLTEVAAETGHPNPEAEPVRRVARR